MRWIRITMWNVWRRFIVPKKVEKNNDHLFVDTSQITWKLAWMIWRWIKAKWVWDEKDKLGQYRRKNIGEATKLHCFISHSFRYHSPSLFHSCQFYLFFTCTSLWKSNHKCCQLCRHYKSPVIHNHLISLWYHISVVCHPILFLWS